MNEADSHSPEAPVPAPVRYPPPAPWRRFASVLWWIAICAVVALLLLCLFSETLYLHQMDDF